MDLQRAFEILEIKQTASPSEIKQAYRDLVLIWHPDRCAQNPRLQEKASEKMKELNAAYDYIRLHIKFEKNESQNTWAETTVYDEYMIIRCPNCGTRNRVNKYKNEVIIKCGKCGFNIFDEYYENKETDHEERILCGDGECIGVIGSNGKCTVCGKTLLEGKESDKHKENLRNQIIQQHLKKQKKRRIITNVLVSLAIFVVILSFYLIIRSDQTNKKQPYQVSVPNKIIPKSVSPYNTIPSTQIDTNIFPNKRLPNGTIIRSKKLDGYGRLTIKNGLATDAAAKLIDIPTEICVAYFYIRAGTSFTLKGIDDGSYRLIFVAGEDWDQKRKIFNRYLSCSEFSKMLDFHTIEQLRYDQINTQYSIFEVTLHQVPGGNVRTSRISHEEFSRY